MTKSAWREVILIGLTHLAFIILFASLLSSAYAQTPNPVTPGYQVCSTASGSTKCGWIAVDSSNPLPVTTSGGGGSQNVNITEVGGNAVTTTVPVSGNVGITGTPSVTVTGAASLATAQVSITTASTQAVAARTGRRSVMITNVTGTQPIYCTSGTATTANGQYIPGLAGASLTLPYSGVVNCIASTSAQTVSVAEVY